MTEKMKQKLGFMINVAYAATILLLVYVAFKFGFELILPFILAFCIVSLVDPLIRRITRLLNKKQAVISVIVMVIMYLIVGFVLFSLIVQAVVAIGDVFRMLPSYYEHTIRPNLSLVWVNFSRMISNMPQEWQNQFEAVQDALMQNLYNMLQNISQKGIAMISGLTGKVPSFLIAFVFTIVLSFFISMQYDNVVLFIKKQLPPKVTRVLHGIRAIIKTTVLRYLSALAKLMFITFIELSVGLLVLKTENAILIAAAISVFDALPLFGTGGIVIPWALLELLKGNYYYAGGLVILYAIVVVVRNIMEPKIVGDQLGLNPIVSLVSIYLGYKLIGIFGMIFMPMLTQIALELHRRGTIQLFRDMDGPGSHEDTHILEERG